MPLHRSPTMVAACRVVATCRRPDQSSALQQLQAQHGPARLQLLTLDVTDENSIEAAAEQVAQRHDHLDLVINSAGLLHIPGVMTPGGCGLRHGSAACKNERIFYSS